MLHAAYLCDTAMSSTSYSISIVDRYASAAFRVIWYLMQQPKLKQSIFYTHGSNANMNSRKKIVLLVFVFFQLLVAFRTRHTLIRDIGYVTRPLWGKNNDFANVKWIRHFSGMGMCESHNWQPRQGDEPFVYDVFMFSSELDILDIRLRELWDVVDFFVLVESLTYYSGEPKPAYFAQNLEQYK